MDLNMVMAINTLAADGNNQGKGVGLIIIAVILLLMIGGSKRKGK